MLGISCLVKNTTLRQDLNDLVEYIAYSRVSNNLDAGIASIYNDIRQAGVEVDLQTVGYIYNDVLPKSFSQFSSDEDVNKHILKNYNDAIRRAALLENPAPKEGQIGQDKPEIAVVDRILNMFYHANTNTPAPQFTDMRTMQEALWNGVKRKLKLPENKKPQTKDEWEPLLVKALGYEQLGLTDVYGKLNSIADLFEATKEQLRDATQKLEAQGDFETGEKFADMTDKLKAATYSYLFSQKEGKDFVKSILKDAGFTKVTPSGKEIIDWNKLSNDIGSVQDLRNNIDNILSAKGFDQKIIDGVKDSLADEFNEVHAKILQYRLNSLANKEEAIGKAMNGKSDLRRLAELNNLGIFQSAHDRLLNSVIGISDLQQQDLADLEQLAKAASNLYRDIDKNYGSDVFASSALQSIQRHIDRIIQRNINNKTTLLKIISAIKNFFDIYLTGLLMAPLTITENFISGIKEIAAPMFLGKKGVSKGDFQLYKSVLVDVMQRGQSFGEEVGSFAPRELYSNTLQYKWKGATKKELAESVLNVLMTPARIGLLGFDSANKAVITNKVFYNAMYQSLKQHGSTDEQATEILSRALNGMSYKRAMVSARNILQNLNTQLPVKAQIPINKNTIVRLANDLVKANLNSNGAITNEMIESTLKGAYHVAGYGLGHEANNFLSQGVKGIRDAMMKKEQQFVQDKDWGGLAWQRAKGTFVNSVVLKFTGGATNWLWLRAQSGLGLGLATGFLGKWNSDLDFKNKDTIKQSIKDVQGARNQIGRALTGLSFAALGYTLYFAMGGGSDDQRKRKRLKDLQDMGNKQSKEELAEMKQLKLDLSLYKRIKSNYQGNRLFKKTSPDLMLLHYYMDINDDAFQGALDYAINTGGLSSDYSTSGKIGNAMKLVKRGDTEGAGGEIGSLLGNQAGVPLWRAYKEWYKMGNWISGHDVSSDFKKPSNFVEGVWGGGALEDIGAYKRNSSITILPGVGEKSYDRFKEKGYSNMNDLKKNPDWYNETYINESGNEVFILDKNAREKAKEGADKWFKQMQ